MRTLLTLFVFVLFSCSQVDSNNANFSDDKLNDKIKQELLSLERKWLEAEFALDTAYLSMLLDSTFTGISANRILNKQEELKGMYENISAMRQDSIFLDSLKLEEAVINVYDNAAVVTFIVHTYKKDKGTPVEKERGFMMYGSIGTENGKLFHHKEQL